MSEQEGRRCQSCGMPLHDEENCGIEADGTISRTYCSFCYQDGAFTKPDLTMEQMIDLSIDNMVTDLQIPEDRAHTLAIEVIPTLARWRGVSEAAPT